MKVPLVDLKIQYQNIKDEIDSAIQDVLDNATFVMGEHVSKFEKEFAEFCGIKHSISASTGTDALYLALKANGIKQGDEVITVPNTFIATTEAIALTGARPVFIDIDKYHTIDVLKIENAITDKTKAIIPVHLYGQPCNMGPIKKIAEKHSLKIIEDCCQAHGAKYKNKTVPICGTGCFSFYPGKNLGAYGDGGIVATEDKEVAEKISMLRDHGRKENKYIHQTIGYNMRLDALQAAVLRVKLKYLDEWNQKRRKNAKVYAELLRDTVEIPLEAEYAKHVYHLYVIRNKNRDIMKKYLEEQDISCSIHYPLPLHLQPALRYLDYKENAFPITEQFARDVLSLPMFAELTEQQIIFIADKIKEFLKQKYS